MGSIFIVNTYSPPKQKKAKFQELFQGASKLAKGNTLVVLGDFNARDKSWGYKNFNVKGKTLAEAAENAGYILLTDPETPTRVGNSVCTDTCPDLTFIKGPWQAQWENLMENLGSDHYILKTQVTSDRLKRQLGKVKITDWNAFRKACDRHLSEGGIQSIEEWGNILKQREGEHTKEVKRTTQTPEVDARLLRLWEARRGLIKRWKRQKHNRKLRLKIAEITTKAEEYAAQLARTNWQHFSDSLNGTLSTARTWHILKALIDPTKTKAENNKSIYRLIHQFEGTDEELLDKVRVKCFGDTNPAAYTGDYRGRENPSLDRPITREEVYAAIRSTTRNTATGADKINNALIRNLSDELVAELTDFLKSTGQRRPSPMIGNMQRKL
ncbi:uncharacterized protein [Dermacentor andersoni]|uniref:uncharacterized protein n=1 Tax=Dermacentor andersoni TaxID=34620 RepID=UPI003B3BD745